MVDEFKEILKGDMLFTLLVFVIGIVILAIEWFF